MTDSGNRRVNGGLKHRLQKQWTVFAFGLGVVFFLLSVFFSYAIEDALLNRHLQQAAKNYQQLDEQARQTWQPSNPSVTLFRRREDMPQEFQAARSLQQGRNMEIEDSSGAYFHILRIDNADPQFLVLDVSEQMVVNSVLSTLFITFLLIVVLLMATAWVIASRFIQSALAPLEQLTATVESGQIDSINPRPATALSTTEVDVLANALIEAWQTSQQALDRELTFARGISHELRTPLQVARSSLDLMLDQGVEGSVPAPLQRLQRAHARLGRITEACLWLLGDSAKPVEGLCDAEEQLRLAVDELADELEQRGKVINLTCTASPQWRCPPEVLQLIAINLMRNAMQHGCGPDIDIRLRAASLTISNRIERRHDNAGFGVGLTLLRRLCDRFNFDIVYKPPLTRSEAVQEYDARVEVIISVT